jgi:hypothetical protein
MVSTSSISSAPASRITERSGVMAAGADPRLGVAAAAAAAVRPGVAAAVSSQDVLRAPAGGMPSSEPWVAGAAVAPAGGADANIMLGEGGAEVPSAAAMAAGVAAAGVAPRGVMNVRPDDAGAGEAGMEPGPAAGVPASAAAPAFSLARIRFMASVA